MHTVGYCTDLFARMNYKRHKIENEKNTSGDFQKWDPRLLAKSNGVRLMKVEEGGHAWQIVWLESG